MEAKEIKNIQQLVFAGGHPPNYLAADLKLKITRADEIACSLESVVVCDRGWMPKKI